MKIFFVVVLNLLAVMILMYLYRVLRGPTVFRQSLGLERDFH